jgi:hypothetical protein
MGIKLHILIARPSRSVEKMVEIFSSYFEDGLPRSHISDKVSVADVVCHAVDEYDQ